MSPLDFIFDVLDGQIDTAAAIYSALLVLSFAWVARMAPKAGWL